MASLHVPEEQHEQQQQPSREEQQQQRQDHPMAHEFDCDDEDLDPVLAVHLASHLTLSSSGSETEGGVDIGSCAVSLPGTVSPATPRSSLPISSAAQPYLQHLGRTGIMPDGQPDARRDGWPEDAALTLHPLNPSWTVDAPSPALAPSLQALAEREKLGMGDRGTVVMLRRDSPRGLSDLPNEVLLQILSYLEVCDLLATSRTSHHLRTLSLSPSLQRHRLRHARAVLPPMLSSPSRPSLSDLIRRHIFLTNTTVVSRRLARNFISIRLSRQLAARPSPEVLVERCVLPPECVPGTKTAVAPALVARRRAVEREKVKDALRRFLGSVTFKGGVREREEGVKKWEERVGVGRVWRLRRFWEGVSTSAV
ncbi:hypothetical protein QBC35DRAFT_46227 [Podospora australis]|uniref:F-box domain-containing protein n=1 Tax=Podospora australis TaxID=1536484 RepID=A0AAN6WNP8_9PEZI|nr:hypothetical protein QBC35DRAFT_46227 [Podospora australis]